MPQPPLERTWQADSATTHVQVSGDLHWAPRFTQTQSSGKLSFMEYNYAKNYNTIECI